MSPRGASGARATSRSAGGRLQAGPTGLETPRRGEHAASPKPFTKRELGRVYDALLAQHGEQQWWPTAATEGPEQRLEICLGAILTQNTSWRGAAAALENLGEAGLLSCEAILEVPEDALGDLVRPSGHFRVKARKLQSFAGVVVEEHGGDIDALLAGTADEVRTRLLAIWGIGPETADAITLYAARRPTFVVDAYAYRLFERLGRPPGPRRYDVYREYFLRLLGASEDDVWTLNEWHALIVRHGQRICRKTTPLCGDCALLDRCPFGKTQ
ncbi:MAG: endonuclease III domain-containing protein [Dehalococcoidia bacterium]